jgi:UPF0716 family protein affecting phage T7 exclusion
MLTHPFMLSPGPYVFVSEFLGLPMLTPAQIKLIRKIIKRNAANIFPPLFIEENRDFIL